MSAALVPAAARRTAERTLTANGTATRSTGDSYNPGTGTIAPGTPETIWAGCCSISPPTANDRTDTIGDDRLIGALVARLPAEACRPSTTTGDPAAIRVGDTLTIADTDYTVKVLFDRTTTVLRRLLVVEVTDAEGVPR